MNRKEEETCRCGAPSETPTHIFIECIRYSERRPETLNGHEKVTQKYLKETVEKLWEEEREELRRRVELKSELRSSPIQ